MKNFKLFLVLIVFASSSVFCMEQGIDAARKAREESARIIPAQNIAGLPQNIWTNLVPLLIDRKGKTEAEIFRITDLMFYPKANQDPTKIISQSPDKEKVAKQLALSQALNNYIKTVGRKEAIKNYEEFKRKTLILIKSRKLIKAHNPEFLSIDELYELNKINWMSTEGQEIANKILKMASLYKDLDLIKLILIMGIDENYALYYVGQYGVHKTLTSTRKEPVSPQEIEEFNKIIISLLKAEADPLKEFDKTNILDYAKNQLDSIKELYSFSTQRLNYTKLEEFITLLERAAEIRSSLKEQEQKQADKKVPMANKKKNKKLL